MTEMNVTEMNEIRGQLEAWGAQPSQAVARMLGDEPFYWKLLRDFRDTPDIELLRFFAGQRNYREAFRAAHSMKGAAVILSLTPLAIALEELVELMRPYAFGEEARAAAGNSGAAARPAANYGVGNSGAARQAAEFGAENRAAAEQRIAGCMARMESCWEEFCEIV